MVSHHSLSRKLLSVSSLLQPAQIQTVLETGRSILRGSHLASIIQASSDIHEVLGREENRNMSSTPSYEGAYSQEVKESSSARRSKYCTFSARHWTTVAASDLHEQCQHCVTGNYRSASSCFRAFAI